MEFPAGGSFIQKYSVDIPGGTLMAANTSNHMLSGYKVLDFTQYVAGPTVTRLMAEMRGNYQGGARPERRPFTHFPL